MITALEPIRRRSQPRRVLLVITDLDVGGAEKCCVQLATGLDRSRWSPEVCSLARPGALADRLAAAGIPVHTLAAESQWAAPVAILRLARLIRQIRPTLLHTFLFHANMVGRLAARIAGVPRVLSSIRVAERRYRYHLILENATCRLSRRIVCVSNSVARFTREHSHVPAALMVVIPNGVDIDSEPTRPSADLRSLGLPRDAVIALYVGRLDPQKGVDVLLRALSIAANHTSDLHAVLAGTGPQRDELKSLAVRLGITGRVHFLGWRADVPELLRAADLFVMPSRWEGMPNAVLEAMAAGLPVVATRTEGTVELVRDRETGRLVAIDDSDELATVLIELAGNPDRRRQWGQRGQQVAQGEFSLAHMISQYEQLYESLLA